MPVMAYHDSPEAAVRQVGLELRDQFFTRRRDNPWLSILGYTLPDGTRCTYEPGVGLTVGDQVIDDDALDAVGMVVA